MRGPGRRPRHPPHWAPVCAGGRASALEWPGALARKLGLAEQPGCTPLPLRELLGLPPLLLRHWDPRPSRGSPDAHMTLHSQGAADRRNRRCCFLLACRCQAAGNSRIGGDGEPYVGYGARAVWQHDGSVRHRWCRLACTPQRPHCQYTDPPSARLLCHLTSRTDPPSTPNPKLDRTPSIAFNV